MHRGGSFLICNNEIKKVIVMDSVDRSAVTPNKSKSRLARTFAKVLHIRAVTGIAPDDGIQKINSPENVKSNLVKNKSHLQPFDDEDEKLCSRAATEAFVAKLFASVSSVKAAYAQLQYAQSPYDPDGIQTADEMVVSELKNVSELKQCYLKKQIDESSPETTQILAEIQEQKSLLKTYEIMGKKLDSQLKLKDSELTFLREKLEEANKENKLLEKRLNSSGQLSSALDNVHLSSLSPSHFITFVRQTIKSIRSFVRLLISEMESAEWDLDAAASSIEPGVAFWKNSHKCYAFESFVCREMFDGFNQPDYSISKESLPEQKKRRRVFFEGFRELKSVKPMDYLAWKPKSAFAKFCRAKYLTLIHPKMETSLFGNLDQRNLANAGEYPETTFFAAFAEMAKRIWLLHCLALSFKPEASIFQVNKRSRFSEVYMESVSEEAFLSSDGSPESEPRVAFTVFPGFRIGKTAVQCQVYLC
ncbi:protein GRAVITROPIC IN THE LIGHT 1-like isoform X1 [Coffea arabica]|uniref:Protein GRAVITROPIC IN THE LIGHT 1-like isoform X1 n=2 Tax=Coffea arabica TaxID=13443 RepID=A0A6P6SGP0_COFAR|nr:protein GRAVITROPIC IN THE LIGHT 1-like isoform X2 [Coffea arabica]